MADTRHRFVEMPEFDPEELEVRGWTTGMFGPRDALIELDPDDFE